MSSGFLCPECHQDLGSVTALMSHFSQYHQTQTSAENSVKSGLKKLIGKKSEIPSQKGKIFTWIDFWRLLIWRILLRIYFEAKLVTLSNFEINWNFIALDREEEERRKVLENDSLLTLTGGVDTSIWTRQVNWLSLKLINCRRKLAHGDHEWMPFNKHGETI